MDLESNYILHTFLQCIKLDSYGFLDNILASNCVFEWFGKTIRSKTKIKQFCRYELRQLYEHNFTEANHCLPFECKPSHQKTMIEPIENFITKCNTETSVNYNDNNDVFETPTEKSSLILKSIDKISNLNKSSNDDDCDDNDDVNMTGIEIIKTPTNSPITVQLNNNIKPLKRKRNQFKRQLNFNSSEEDDDSNSVSAKKISKLNSCDDIIPLASETIKSETTTNSKYSKLYYLEAHGMIRTISKTKHNGITNISFDSPMNNISNTDEDDDDDDDDDHYINNDDIINSTRNYSNQSYGGGRCWDRRTKLKISYRIGNENLSTSSTSSSSSSSSSSVKDMQIALIIFEHITKNVNTRRNLLTDFEETIKLKNPIDKNQRKKVKPIQKRKVTNEKTLTSLRRLRF